MKRKLFIGSSKEGLPFANKLKDLITKECGDWLECSIWDEGGIFALNKSTLENLVKAARRFDYGILVATNDDLALSRNELKIVPRDNVIFEMGLFLGSLGLTRAFLVTQECKLPSDYNGITTIRIPDDSSSDFNLNDLILQLKSTQDTFALKTIPSTALAVGYFDNFVKPFCQKSLPTANLHVIIPGNISDVKSITKFHESQNSSENISIYGDNQRPMVKKLISDETYFWDIPSTLSTLYKMINMVIPDQEIGKSIEKKEWIDYELRNFEGTLKVLLHDNIFCKNKVHFEYL